MTTWLAIAAILGALSLGVISPGPSFVLVARIAVARSRRDGVAAALGMGAGGLAFGVLALLGLHTLLMQVESLYVVLRIAGGVYLVCLGVRLWRGAGQPVAAAPAHGGGPARRGAYMRARLWLDRVAGFVLGALGLRLVADAARP